ncbi:hypothetical protein B0H13DRAFT_2334974 [Mycena leptocephala]|nr:hypothetical protein B0H13DRAFT_2334974 [Mycena leptocephala]
MSARLTAPQDFCLLQSWSESLRQFFPGTGKLEDNGYGIGKHFCLNVPLKDGIDDDMYLNVFNAAPTHWAAIGSAHSTCQSRRSECVNFVRKLNLPLLVLGGGGYTIKNVSRCWTYETSVLAGATIPNELPATVYDSFFKDSQFKLHPPLTGKVDNQNSPASLQRITISIRNKLRYLQGAPSVAMQEIPPDIQGFLHDEERTFEERQEETSTATAGELRSDRVTTRNDYFEGDNDNDQVNVFPEPPISSRGRAVSAKRRRPARARRGSGKGGPSSTHGTGKGIAK